MFKKRLAGFVPVAMLVALGSVVLAGPALAAEPPTVTKIEPTSGPAAGGTAVTITGTGFSGASAVNFGSTAATSFTVNSETSITAVSPPGVPGYPTGKVNVTVTTPAGTSEHKIAGVGEFAYDPIITGIEPNTGPTGGGTLVTIHGEGFAEPPQPPPPFAPHAPDCVSFSGSTFPCTEPLEVSNTLIRVVSPAGTGTVDVRVTNLEGGTSATSPADLFGYGEPPPPVPTVTKVEPNHGPATGGTTVTITGTNLAETKIVEFGGEIAQSFTVNSATSITAVSPAGTPGRTVDVTVATGDGTSTTSEADRFTYSPTPDPVPRWFVNGQLGPTLKHEPFFFLGKTEIHNAILETLACENFVASTFWNEVKEGTERGFEETVGYGTWDCTASKPVMIKNTKGETVQGVFATAEGPPEEHSEKGHKSGSTSLPWTGELTEKEPKAGVHEKYIVTNHVKVWVVVPLCTEEGGTGEGGGCLLQGSEIPLEDKEGPTEKEELKFVNGVRNGLSPSKVAGGTGHLESGFGAGSINDEFAAAGATDFELVQAR